MEKPAEKSLAAAVSDAAPLARTLRAQSLFEALDRKLRPAFSSGCREQVQVACVRDDTLVLAATSPAWASRARLEAPGILEAARRIWPGTLKGVQVIVVPPLHGGERP